MVAASSYGQHFYLETAGRSLRRSVSLFCGINHMGEEASMVECLIIPLTIASSE